MGPYPEVHVNRMLVAALAALAISAARADEPPKAVPAPAPEAKAGKAAEEKAAKPGPEPKAAEPKGEAKPDKPKPCEPVKPCAID